jgi:hypothetical protein
MYVPPHPATSATVIAIRARVDPSLLSRTEAMREA